MAEYRDTVPEKLQIQRRTPESRAAYIAEKVPIIAKRFNCTEEEARALLEGVDGAGAALVTLPEGHEVKVTPAVGSIRFVLERPDDERLNFSIEFEGQGAEEIVASNHDEHGWDGMGLLADTVRSIGTALGIEVVER